MMINLNKRFYSLQSINATIEAFKDICDARVEESDRFTIILQSKTQDIDDEELKNEFCNYCLGMMRC
jgi:hypothetical protein